MQELQQLKNWWLHPTTPNEQTVLMAQKILAKYPWFAPARLMTYMYAQSTQTHGYYPPIQAYAYNPIKYYELLSATQQNQTIGELLMHEGSGKDIDEVIEKINAQDYFFSEGITVSTELPDLADMPNIEQPDEDTQKDLMVMMSFADWLQYFKTKKQADDEEEASKRALKAHWQKEKLAAALEEEHEEIPEQVFEMAMSSIQQDEEPISEVYAALLAQQGKHGKAIEMYKKLSLKNPDKSGFFAAKIEKIRNSIQ